MNKLEDKLNEISTLTIDKKVYKRTLEELGYKKTSFTFGISGICYSNGLHSYLIDKYTYRVIVKIGENKWKE